MGALGTPAYADEISSYIHPLNASIQSSPSPFNSIKNDDLESPYERIKKRYSSGHTEEAITQAKIYLNKYPTDSDVRLLLGRIFFSNKDYQDAREELLMVLQQTPNYSDASVLLINVDMSLTNYQEALDIANSSLLLDPTNTDLIGKRSGILYTIGSEKLPALLVNKNTITRPVPILYLNVKEKKIIATINTHKIHQKNQNKTKKMAEPPVEPKKYKNEIGIIQQQYYISDVKKTWDYSTLYYGRETPIGKVYGKINYNARFGQRAIQEEIEAYPKLNKNIYLDIDVAHANQPNLFPNQIYGAEAYVSVKEAFDFSVGSKYNIIDARHNFSLYTGTISKAIKSNLITFRPYYFVPGVGSASTLYTINFRHILREPYYYFGCMLGAGTSPDLASLETVGFIVVKNRLINPYINFPLLNERLIVNLNMLYLNQIFPRHKVRDWTGGTVGLAWKF